MITKFLTAALAGAALSVLPVLASAADLQTSPIDIQNVQVSAADRSDDGSISGPSVTISYANTSPVPATDVVFALVANNRIINSYEDTGTFSTGSTISHTFVDFSPAEDTHIVVDYVAFSDGSTWVNPALATVAAAPVPSFPMVREADTF
jgi:hypothetical protein